MSSESLSEVVNRAKARWLKRVMYAPTINSTEKVLAFAIADHLNCVTLDSWPKQVTLISLLGRKSVKTIKRATRKLQACKVITVSRSRASRSREHVRYVPVFLASDWDKPGRQTGQMRAECTDSSVHQSNLSIYPKSVSTASKQASGGTNSLGPTKLANRGTIEIKIAELLGADGIELLGHLAEVDDGIVDRLCRAFNEGRVGERELAAARLAAKQVRR